MRHADAPLTPVPGHWPLGHSARPLAATIERFWGCYQSIGLFFSVIKMRPRPSHTESQTTRLGSQRSATISDLSTPPTFHQSAPLPFKQQFQSFQAETWHIGASCRRVVSRLLLIGPAINHALLSNFVIK